MEKRCSGCMRMKAKSPVCEHCGFDERIENAPGQLPVGTVLHGQYLVGKTLGQGGFGITYLGWDMALQTPVAVKEYYPHGYVDRDYPKSLSLVSRTGSADEVFRQNRSRFLKEAQTLAQLKNVPGVVRVHNLFEENNTAYIVMEYIRGVDLRNHIKNHGRPMTVQETLFLMRPVMEALVKVHEKDLIHRDISPDNIMLQSDGSTKLLDFGAVREVIDPNADKELAKSTEAILKHGFAPVEQYQRRGSLGPWTDVYALCATIYYCLTGSVPADALERMTDDSVLNWRGIPDLTARQIAALKKGMAILPQNRTASVAELYRELYAPAKTEVQSSSAADWKKTAIGAAAAAAVLLIVVLAYSFKSPHTHSWDAATCIQPKTCFDCGETKGTALGHSWEAATCEQPKTCFDCGETKGAALGHSWIEATSQQPRTCYICGAVDGAAADDTAVDAIETTEAKENSVGMIAAGNYHSVYLSTDGRVYAAGKEALGSFDNRGSRLDVYSWSDIVAISAASHTVGVKSDGTVVAVGVDTYGQCNVGWWTDIVAVDAGDNHTVGLRSDGTVVAVGDNSEGQCNVSGWGDIVQVAAAGKTTFGLTKDGRVLSAGEKNYGHSWTDITAICAGTYHLVGLKQDGTVVQTGSCDGWERSTDDWYNIVAISAGSVHTVGLRSDGTVVSCGGTGASEEQLNVGSWYDIVAISAGMYHTVGLRSDGTIVATGKNQYKQCDIVNFS